MPESPAREAAAQSANDQQNKALLRRVLKAKQGDEQAFAELYDFYFEKIYRFIFYRVSHKEIAEDLAEDVFIKAWTNIKGVKEHSFGGWLYRIAKNRVIDHYRQERVTVDIFELENVLEADNNLSEETNLIMDRKLFMDLVRKLTPEQQIIIQLKFIEELDNDEIAELISKKEGAIRVIQHRAILKLQELLDIEIKNTNIDYAVAKKLKQTLND